VLAKQLATLDQLSGGRVTLGVGTGWMREEFEVLGVGFSGRGARLEEHVTLMRQTWEHPVSSFSGAYYQMPEAGTVPGPVSGRIPVLFGGHSDAALDRAARLGDGWAVTAQPSDDVIGAYAERMRKLRELCEKAGRRYEDLRIVAQSAPTAGVDHLRRLAELGVHEVSLVSHGRPDLTIKLLDRLPTQIT
jgi:alkanesulfonate monooxygenase SsuD/methylene tetrahydromethanopterin reductase-like flavin-dependent oxidoreductase (luciferase family)